MPITVEAGDNEIEFPDGTSDAVIKSALAKHYGETAPKPSTSPFPPVSEWPGIIGTGLKEGIGAIEKPVMHGIGVAASDVGNVGVDALNSASDTLSKQMGTSFGQLDRLEPGKPALPKSIYDAGEYAVKSLLSPRDILGLPTSQPSAFAAGMAKTARKAVEGFTTPEGFATLPLLAFKLGKAAFGLVMASQTPDQIKAAVQTFQDPKSSNADKWEALGDAGVNIAMLAGIALGLKPEKVKETMGPEDAAKVANPETPPENPPGHIDEIPATPPETPVSSPKVNPPPTEVVGPPEPTAPPSQTSPIESSEKLTKSERLKLLGVNPEGKPTVTAAEVNAAPPINPGGAQANLPTEQQAVSKANNSRDDWAGMGFKVLEEKPAEVPSEKPVETPSDEPTKAPPVEEPSPQPSNRYRIGKSPQPHTLIEELPATDVEKANGEQAVVIKNERTGELQTVLKSELTPVKASTTRGPGTGEGPGSPPVGPLGVDPKAQIEQLEESFRGIEGKKVSFADKVKEAFKLGDIKSKAKDAVGKALDGLRTSGQLMRRKFLALDGIDDMLKAKGELSSEVETRGWRLRQFEKTVKRSMPDIKERAAVAKYVDAGGDAAELQRGLAEAPAQYKQAYQDALNFTPKQKIAAENVRNYFEARLDEAIDAGVLQDGVDDYLHRIYEKDPAKLQRAKAYVQSGILNANPALAKKRVFQFDWEAEKLGYKPVQDFLPRLLAYESSLSRAIAARDFIKKATTMRAADGRPVVDIKGVGIPIENPQGIREGTLIKPQFNPAKANDPSNLPNYRSDYVNREYPALSRWKWVGKDAGGKPIFVQGDVAIHPDYVGRVDALLEPSRLRYGRYSGVTRPLLSGGATVKSTMLDFSGFHQVQLAVHALEHRINPFRLDKDIDFNDPNVTGLLKDGLTIGGDYHMASEGVFGKSLSRLVPGIGPLMETYHHWLFQDFIPRLKVTMAKEALERNMKRFKGQKSEAEIMRMTAEQSNAAFGGQNNIMLERSKTAQDMARLIFLAPDFLESRAKFTGQAMQKGGKGGVLSGNEQRTALLLGALTMYTAARAMNYAISGQTHNEPENAFSVVYNGKAYGLRTIQGDIIHLVSNPASFWLHRLNPMVTRPMLEAMTGRDEFGRKRDWMQQVWDDVSVVAPVSLRSSAEKSLYESLSNGFGVTARRFNESDHAFELAQKWKKANGIQERGEFIYDRDKDPLRPLKVALANGDEGESAKQIKNLIASKAYTSTKLGDYFKRYESLPFTGSNANDAKFIKTLSDDEKKTVEAARQSKHDIRKLYIKAMGQYRAAENERKSGK